MTEPAFAGAADNATAIDREHLRQMTLGDRALEREVLVLFDKQASLLVDRMRKAEPEAVFALAHALKGSARGIGAFRVAHAAAAVERGDEAAGAFDAALNALDVAVAQARAAIALILQSHALNG